MTWLTNKMDKHINHVLECLDCYIARHRWIDGILIRIDQEQSNRCTSCLQYAITTK